MVIGKGRRAAAALVSAVAALTVAVTVAGRGCGSDDTEAPLETVRAFIAAANAGDREALFSMFGPRTKAALTERARRSTKIVGGARRFEPLDMVSISEAPGDRDANMRLVEVDDNVAVVEIGDRGRMNLVKVSDRWLVEILAGDSTSVVINDETSSDGARNRRESSPPEAER